MRTENKLRQAGRMVSMRQPDGVRTSLALSVVLPPIYRYVRVAAARDGLELVMVY
jgi:hypothetical protein